MSVFTKWIEKLNSDSSSFLNDYNGVEVESPVIEPAAKDNLDEDATLPSITINNIKFTIIKQTKYKNTNREVVKIKSGEKYTFWVYRSNSELGLWRFCLQDETILYKGVDYIQTTLVHLELQNFININIHNVPTILINYLDDENTTERSDECYCIDKNTNVWDMFYKQNKCNIQKIVTIINDKNRMILESPFKEMYNNKNKINCGTISDDINIYDYMNDFSKILETEFVYEEEKKLFEYNNVFENIINVTNNIYSVKLTRKTPNPANKTNEIVLYFDIAYLQSTTNAIHSSFKNNITKICKMPFHIFPFLITTTASKINCLGLYSDYIFTGPYLCKLFDYSFDINRQCTVTEDNEYKCTPAYTYIGKRYLNLFPLKNIIEKLQNKCAAEQSKLGGSRRHTKKTKRKQSKRRKHMSFRRK